MNNFYKQPKLLQWIEALLLLIIGFLPALSIIQMGFEQPLSYLLFIPYTPLSQFTSTPFFRLSGVYTYYSPMLLGYMASNTQIDMHSGTSFDYLFVMRKFKKGTEFKNRILMFHLEGLLKIIQGIENKEIPESVSIVGTSYFFNDRTIQKLGFETKTPSVLYRINLLANFIDLFWMYSLAQGKLSVPKVWSAKKAGISGAKLLENKTKIIELYNKLNKKITA
jgi:hypothetical protein